MKKFLFILLLIGVCSTQAAFAQETGEYHQFVGKIGPYAITLFFDAKAARTGDCGYYFYNDRPKTHFTLKLKSYNPLMRDDATGMPVAWGHHWVFDEYTPKGNHTGTFDGIEIEMGDTFDGTFTNQKGEKFEFKLTRQYE